MQSSKLEFKEKRIINLAASGPWVRAKGNLLHWWFGECAIWTVVLSIYLIDAHSLHAVKE